MNNITPENIASLFTDLAFLLIAILIFIALLIFRKPISSLFDRFRKLNLRNGDAEVCLTVDSKDDDKSNLMKTPSAPPISSQDTQNELENDETLSDSLYSKAMSMLGENKYEEAEKTFEQFEQNEGNSKNFHRVKAIFFYLLYTGNQNDKVITSLKELADTNNDFQKKYEILVFLCNCYEFGNQHDKVIAVWEEYIKSSPPIDLVTKAKIEIAITYIALKQPSQGKSIILKMLKTQTEHPLISRLYSSLSKIESALGNHKESILCMDKALEYDPFNKGLLFDCAYKASNSDLEELSISNYFSLLKIDENNELALNNLGVHAKNQNLNIKAIELYTRSSDLKNTLAMANKGNMLLNAGFIDEAEAIAKEALKQDDIHENIYDLLSSIAETKQQQEETWNKLHQHYINYQDKIRAYVKQYYVGDEKDIAGTWQYNEHTLTMQPSENKFEITWIETALSKDIFTKITGTITGATFQGRYSRNSSNQATTLLTYIEPKDFSCLGFVNEDKSELVIFSEKEKNQLNIIMTK